METIDKRPVLVTWDFTEKSGFALEHGASLAKILGTYLALVHIVKKDKDVADGEKKISSVVSETEKKSDVKTTAIVKEGTIFTTITEAATELNAEMVIMGTHGMKGMQK